MLTTEQKNKVENIIRDVGDNCIFPYFQNLVQGDISYKESINDPVTIADQKAEALLKDGLTALLPDSLFVGEELYATDKTVLRYLDQSDRPVWLVDPIDGTSNFIKGKAGFGIMVCLLDNGVPVASWFYEVPAKKMVAFYAPRSLSENGQPMPFRQGFGKPYKGLIGQRLHQFPEMQKLKAECQDMVIGASQEPSIIFYQQMLAGEIDFLVFKVAHPWDHLPGIAMVASNGAVCAQWSGEAIRYSAVGAGIVVARNSEILSFVLKNIVEPLSQSESIMALKSFK